ncbi:hypothetical protein K9M18_06450 [Candidatus Woesearchaeota archaeon]|nr:hypothetical protein [Candidatus Woesearchaeota archaeon]
MAESIAKSYKEAALQIGLSVGRAKGFSQAFKGSVAAVAKFGGELSDVQDIYQYFIESSGRVRILGEDEVENIFKLGKAANLVGSEATSLYESFDLMGISNVSATERMEELIVDSQKIGLNSSKVVKTLASNMKTIQQYSFANGVKGMTEMAKLAVKMRMDVSDMLGMADKFYEPEAAIEAAANLQMLGGDIAKAFGDPFETMYLARNKPEELAKKVGDMVENMMQFNESTGEYEFPAEARMQLKAAGDQLGINVDSMIEMSRQAAKMKDVKDKLSLKGMFSEEEMEGIASMARLEGGQFKVDVYDEEGKKITKSLDELTAGDAEMLMKMPKDEEDYQSKMIQQSMTTNEILKSIEDSFQKTFIKGFDMYQIIEDSTKKTMEATREMTTQSVKSSLDYIKNSLVGDVGGTGKDYLEKTDAAMAKYIESMTDFISGDADLDVDVENGVINVLGTTEGYNPAANGSTGSAGTSTASTEEIKRLACNKKGGELGTDGICRDSNGTILRLAKGGIVTKPVNDLIGEGGESEVVFPLSKLENFIQTQKMGGKITLEGNPTITLNINSDNPNLTFSEQDKIKMKESIISVVTKMFNNGGLPDGANIPQGSKGFIQTI